MNAHITENNTPAITAGTIARTACLLLALANQLLSACGKPILPIESAQLEQIVTTGITTVAALVSWWENNSFTPEAIHADELLDQMQGKIISLSSYSCRWAVSSNSFATALTPACSTVSAPMSTSTAMSSPRA